MDKQLDLQPRLIVSDPDAAIGFYQKALGAAFIERFVDGGDRVVHAAISIQSAVVSLAQSNPDWGLLDPLSLGGSPCLIHLSIDDPDQVARDFVAKGGQVVVDIADRPYGKREGRVADPFGHLWVLSKTIEDLDADEISRRLKEL